MDVDKLDFAEVSRELRCLRANSLPLNDNEIYAYGVKIYYNNTS